MKLRSSELGHCVRSTVIRTAFAGALALEALMPSVALGGNFNSLLSLVFTIR